MQKSLSLKLSIYSRVQKSIENWSVCSKMALGEVSRRVTPMMMPRPCPSGSRLLKPFFKFKKFVYNGKMASFRGILGQS